MRPLRASGAVSRNEKHPRHRLFGRSQNNNKQKCQRVISDTNTRDQASSKVLRERTQSKVLETSRLRDPASQSLSRVRQGPLMKDSVRRALKQAQAPYCGWLKLNILKFIFIEVYCSCFTMLCQFQLYHKVNQLYVYIHPLFFGFPFHSGHHRALSGVPYAIQQALGSYLSYTQSQQCILVNPNFPTHPTLSSCLSIHMFALYGWVFISALQISSSVSFFQISLISDIIQYAFFSFWLTLLSMTVSRSIHIFENSKFFSFLWLSIFHCMYVPHLLYPFLR